MKKAMVNPEVRAMRSRSLRERRANPEFKARLKDAQSKPEFIVRCRRAATEMWLRPEFIAAQAVRWTNPETRAKYSATSTITATQAWSRPEYAAKQKATRSRPEVKAKRSASASKNWANPEFSIRHRELMMAGMHIKPNKPEQIVKTILDKIDPNKWRFVGDGKTEIENSKHSIGGKFPDFWNGDHKLVELYGDYWHRGENPQDRIDLFDRYGYRCLIIWERELKKQPEQVLGRLIEFVGCCTTT